jgi:predicted NUDIX family NTP pyrophosphohydrolase
MKTNISAGILLFRRSDDETMFLLVHPGGPYFRQKDEGWWTIPKGELLEGEEPLSAAMREFEEETGCQLLGDFIPLSSIRQKGGKTVLCWAMEGDLDSSSIKSNTFEIEWPPRSGKRVSFPEIDQAEWFSFTEACLKINERQKAFLEELMKYIDA